MDEPRTQESLTPGDRAVLDQNWMALNNDLDHLLHLTRQHRATGCADWFCTEPEMTRMLDAYDVHEVHLLLAGAIERILKAESGQC